MKLSSNIARELRRMTIQLRATMKLSSGIFFPSSFYADETGIIEMKKFLDSLFEELGLKNVGIRGCIHKLHLFYVSET